MTDYAARLAAAVGAASASALLLLIPSAAVEGNKTRPYRDVGGIWTVCAGVTGNQVDPHHLYSKAECDRLNAMTIDQHAERALPCVKAPLSDAQKVGLVLFAYNTGAPKFCRSRLVRKLNARDPHACAEITDSWYKAGGRDCRVAANNCTGLIKRRRLERALCEGYPLNKALDLIKERT